MELVNLVVIISMVSISISWAFRKKTEIESTILNFSEEPGQRGEEERRILESDIKQLTLVSNVFQEVIQVMLKQIVNITVLVFLGMSIIVWVSLPPPNPL